MIPVVGPALQKTRDDLREYFTLRGAGERARVLAADTANDLRRDLALSLQKREAAELLWQGGARAEALSLAKEAWSLVDRHAALAPEVKRPPSLEGQIDLPALEDDLRDDHQELFSTLVEAQRAYHRSFYGLTLDDATRRRQSLTRIATAVVVALVALFFVVSSLRKVELTAEASASWGPNYPPSFAVDGKEETHWLLPDKALGHLDVKLSSPKKLSTVSILNGYDPPAYGVVDFRVETFEGAALVKGIDAKMPPQTPGVKPPWMDIDVSADRKVDRVRIVVKSFHDIGGSIAEVKVK